MKAPISSCSPRCRTKILLTTGILALSCALPVNGASPSSDFNRAQKLIAAGDTRGALTVLDTIIHSDQRNAAAHYLKANCLAALGKLTEARSEYSLAERLAPNTIVANYAQLARVHIESSLARQEPGATQNSNATFSEPNAKKTKQAAAAKQNFYAKFHESNTKQANSAVSGNTLEVIRQQAASARQRAITTGELEAAGEVSKAANEARSVQERAQRMAAQMGGREGGGEIVNSGGSAEILRQQAAARAEELQQIGKLKAERKQQESAEKAAEIQRQSESLQNELLDNQEDQHRGIKLNPVGTNLYIRNYSIVTPNITPLHAHARSMPGDRTATQVTSDSVHADRLSGRNAGAELKHTSTDVNGRLLRK